ncbi:cytoplasmic protein [Ramaria rubella]|nr:cytoplasmic protein [Ramaria rubella]
MPFGEIVIGPPGSGKSTYAFGKHQLFTALNRPVCVVNLDPANDNIPYPCPISISSLITLQEVMDIHKLGPNGAMLYCIEYLEVNFDWLREKLEKLEKDVYVVFDLPGQVELWTNHASLKRIIDRLAHCGFRLAAVHLCDAHNVTDAANYVSVLLLSLRTMLQLELPHINVLSKVDLITQYGDLGQYAFYIFPHRTEAIDNEPCLDFNLDFYTEVQDLSYLENRLNANSPRYASLNMAICSLIEDYSLVGFETLAVEDKSSMLHLSRVIDRATGSVFVPAMGTPAPQGTLNPSNAPPSQRPNTYALFSSAAGQMKGTGSDVRDVQERWIDAREEWDAFEKMQWRKEGEIIASQARKVQNTTKIRERK